MGGVRGTTWLALFQLLLQVNAGITCLFHLFQRKGWSLEQRLTLGKISVWVRFEIYCIYLITFSRTRQTHSGLSKLIYLQSWPFTKIFLLKKKLPLHNIEVTVTYVDQFRLNRDSYQVLWNPTISWPANYPSFPLRWQVSLSSCNPVWMPPLLAGGHVQSCTLYRVAL